MAKVKTKVIIAQRVTVETTHEEMVSLAAEIGCAIGTVTGWASVLGLRNPRPEKLLRISTILDYLRAGDSPTLIDHRHWVTKQAVYGALKRNGYRLQRGLVSKVERNAA